MTLILDRSSVLSVANGGKVEVKTENHLAPGEFLRISSGGYVHIEDACAMIEYILENTDIIGADDPRQKLLKRIKSATMTRGHNGGKSVRIKLAR